MLEPAMFFGLGAVGALAPHHPATLAARLAAAGGRARRSLVLRVHVGAGSAGAHLPRLPSHALLPCAVLTLLIPTLTYVLLSWVWLIARILHDLGGRPRGGHPVLMT